jgi:hypothetical protein
VGAGGGFLGFACGDSLQRLTEAAEKALVVGATGRRSLPAIGRAGGAETKRQPSQCGALEP